MNLETERLIIRNFRESDLEDFFEYRSDPKVCELQGFEPFTRENAKLFIEIKKTPNSAKAGEWNAARRRTQEREKAHRRHRFET